MQLCGKSVRSWCDGSSDRSFMVDPLSYFSFHPVFQDWCNIDRPVCWMVHIGKSSPCDGSGLPLSLYEWSFIIWPAPYNRK